MTIWQLIRSWLVRPVDRTMFAPEPARVDPRTVVLPVVGEQNGKTYYEVADMWAKERLGVRRILLGILDGTQPVSAAHGIAADFQCSLGTWLRFVRVDATLEPSLDMVRRWHGIWHDGVNQIVEHFHAGHYEQPRDMLMQRNSAWHYAARKVDKGLEMLWMGRSID